MDRDCRDLDLHRFDLRYADTRVTDARALDRLVRSLEQFGQIVPCIAVSVSDTDRLVLVDGYRRVAALRRLGSDTARVVVWRCPLDEALIGVLTQANGRAFAAIEEALQLRILIQAQGLSQHEVARRCGRDVSWVNRRLLLLSGLSDAVLAAVRGGQLSAWAAVRIVVPLARANTEHAERLLASLAREPLSSRALRCWFEHYRKANRTVRERMVAQPRLLIETLAETDAAVAAEQLAAGPEGACVKDLRVLEAVLKRLRQRLGSLHPVPGCVHRAVPRVQAAWTDLLEEIARDVEDAA